MSNSPPSKVNIESERVLSSGIDTLVLSLDILWKKDNFFSRLIQLKAQASLISDNVTFELKSHDEEISMFFSYSRIRTKFF